MKMSKEEICNGCKNLNFGARKCMKFNVGLSSFTNSENFVCILPCAKCGRESFSARERKETNESATKTKNRKGKRS